jgi:hypothetical protein
MHVDVGRLLIARQGDDVLVQVPPHLDSVLLLRRMLLPVALSELGHCVRFPLLLALFHGVTPRCCLEEPLFGYDARLGQRDNSVPADLGAALKARLSSTEQIVDSKGFTAPPGGIKHAHVEPRHLGIAQDIVRLRCFDRGVVERFSHALGLGCIHSRTL